MDEPIRVRAAAIFSVLGHPTRLQMLDLLAQQPLSVGALASSLGLAQSTASQHLAALLRVGALRVEPQGTTRLYHVRGPRLARMLDLMREFCEVQGLMGEPERGDDA